MKESKKRTVGIFIFHNAEVLDFAGPFEVFSVTSELNNYALFDVSIVAKERNPIRAVNGLSVNPDFAFEDAPPFDILILAGGVGARKVVEDQESLAWVKNTVEHSELTLSVCTGAAILAKLGYLDHKPFCTHHEVYPFVEQLAPTAKPQKEKRFVQSDDKIYTSAGISAGIDLSFHIVEKLHGREVAESTAAYMEYQKAEF